MSYLKYLSPKRGKPVIKSKDQFFLFKSYHPLRLIQQILYPVNQRQDTETQRKT